MNAAPVVSVIVPTFERRAYVRRAVESVLAQSFRDFELIVVDDGSSDGTEEALQGLDDRLRYLRRERGGVEKARNFGTSEARGTLIAFLDDDDRWLPDHLAVVVEVFERNPDCVLVTTCPWYTERGRERPEAARVVNPLPRLFIWSEVGWPSCVTARRDALLRVGGFDERPDAGPETDLYLRLAIQGRFAYLRRRTVLREELPTSLGAARRRSGIHLRGRELSAQRILDELEESPSSDPQLVAQARGNLDFALALQALERRDAKAFRSHVEDASRGLPELSTAPELVVARFLQQVPEAEERQGAVDVFAFAARRWPDQDCPTAVALRIFGARMALQSGRPRLARDLLRGTGVASIARALLRTLRLRLVGLHRMPQSK